MANKSILENFSDEEFKEIVATSFSISEATKKCGFKTYNSGGGRKSVYKRIDLLELDTSHFKANGRQRERPAYNKIINYQDILQKNSDATRTTVKDIVIREQLLEYKCDVCGNEGVWNGQILTLQLHHKDGDHTNNTIENLTFLCPNCHSQTDNYGVKNAKRDGPKKFYCTDCGTEITKDSRTGKCKACAAKLNVIDMPTKVELIEIIKELKLKKHVCYHYGVSDKTLDKWLISYNMPTHISELHKHIKDNQL